MGFFQVIFHLNYFFKVKRKKIGKLPVCFHVFSHKLLKVIQANYKYQTWCNIVHLNKC